MTVFIQGTAVCRIITNGSCPLGIDKRAVVTTLTAHALIIDLRNNQLRFQRETGALTETLAVLIDDGIASIHHILCALTKAAAGIYIAAHSTGTLLREKILEVFMLANQLVGGAEVEDDVSTGQCEAC